MRNLYAVAGSLELHPAGSGQLPDVHTLKTGLSSTCPFSGRFASAAGSSLFSSAGSGLSCLLGLALGGGAKGDRDRGGELPELQHNRTVGTGHMAVQLLGDNATGLPTGHM